jgi:hypothetical protein
LANRAARLQHYFDKLLRFIPNVYLCEELHEFLCSVNVSDMSNESIISLRAIVRVNDAPAVDPVAVDALPRRQEGCGKQNLAVTSAGCCVICQEAMEPSDRDIRILPCGHEYHHRCILQWIPHSNTCCVCKGTAISPPPLRRPRRLLRSRLRLGGVSGTALIPASQGSTTSDVIPD